MIEENKAKFSEMFGIANSYKTSSELLNAANQLITAFAAKQGIKRPNGTAPLKFDEVIITRIILYAINIEILLKALILHDTDNEEKRDHDWDKLFAKLTSSRQSEIINKMPIEYQRDFMQLLTNNKDTFIRWRYCYEYPGLSADYSFVKALADTIGSIVIQLHGAIDKA